MELNQSTTDIQNSPIHPVKFDSNKQLVNQNGSPTLRKLNTINDQNILLSQEMSRLSVERDQGTMRLVSGQLAPMEPIIAP